MNGISQYLEDQHALLELRLAALERAVRGVAFPDAFARLGGFTTHLDRYVRREERLLFPLYERMVDAAPGSTARMRREHAHLRRLAVEVSSSLAVADSPRALLGLGTLRSLLFVHGAKEAWVIYPRVVGGLSAAVEDALVRDLRDRTR